MKNLLVLLGIAFVAQTVTADAFGTVGTVLASLNSGSCKAMVDNPDNPRDTCLVAC